VQHPFVSCLPKARRCRVVHPFVTCPAPDRRSSRQVLYSTVFHALLVGIVIAPSRPTRLANEPRTTAESVRYMSLSLIDAHAGAASMARHARRSARRVVNDASQLSPTLATMDFSFAANVAMPEAYVPELELPSLKDSLPSDGNALDDSPYLASLRRRGTGTNGIGISDSTTFVAADVDRSAMASGANPKPGYPKALLYRGVEATFTTFFVVDSAGRVDTSTIKIPPSVDARFSQSVRDVLRRWRFLPAETRGRRVRQLVEQTFEFRIVPGSYGT
jgi:TonB family protein